MNNPKPIQHWTYGELQEEMKELKSRDKKYNVELSNVLATLDYAVEKNKAIAAERDKLLDLLRGVQWSMWSFACEEHVCPVCENFNAGIHEKDCELGNAIKEKE